MISFKSRTTQKILQYFFTNRSAQPHVRNLARLLGEDASNVSKKLRDLEKEKILLSEESGTKRYYLNETYALLPEVEKLFVSAYGLPQVLRDALEEISGLSRAYIFGSYAKGEFSGESDVDLILIGSHSSLSAKKVILPLQRMLGREFNIVDMTESEFKRKMKARDPFLTAIMKGKLIPLL